MAISDNGSLPVISTGKKTNPSNVPVGFEGVANANPFENYEYQLGIWDHLGNAFGFRTQEDKVREQMALESANYNAQIASTAREEKYNSELESASRLREAGLNPDLTGLGDANKASEFTEPQSMPDAFSAPSASEFAGSMISVMTSLMGVAKDMNSLQMLSQDIEGKRFDNVGKMFKSSSDFLLSVFPDLASTSNKNIYESIHDKVQSLYGDSRFSRKFEKSVLNYFESVGFNRDYYESLEKSSKARANYLTEIGKKLYSGSGRIGRVNGDEQDGFETVLGLLGDSITDYTQTFNEAGASKNRNDKDYQDKLREQGVPTTLAENAGLQADIDHDRLQSLKDSGYGSIDANTMVAQAEADAATADQVKQSKSTQTKLEGVLNRLVNNLDDARKDGGIKGGLASIALAMIMMIQGQMLPHVGYSNRKNVDTATGEVYHTGSLNIGN